MPWEKQFDVDAALGRAMEAFWSQGYEATSTQDLLARMGINRGSLYDTFGSKRELFLKALKHYQATYQGPKVAAAARGRTPRETIGALFDSLVSEALGDTGRCGCLLVNTALELAPHDAEIARVVAAGLRDIESFFRATIENGQEIGEIPRRVEAAEVARALLGMMVGLRVLARSLPDKPVLDAIATRAKAMLA
jgi:TetR/AcrR family transcriptional repressor of nem operon